MKTLLLMRHAKSSWKHEGLSDHERPLNGRGERDAPRMGRWLAQQDIQPDRILASSATRARMTADAVAEARGRPGCIEVRDELYGAYPGDYIKLIRQVPDHAETVMIVGHNPSVAEFVSTLANEYTEMPTAAVACFDVAITAWKAFVPPGKIVLRGLWLPKEIPL